MAITKSAKIEAEIGKVDTKIAELQAKRKELVQKKTDIQNGEIVDIVRGMSIPLDELAVLLQSVKSGGPVPAPAPTSGQLGQKSEAPANDTGEEDNDE